MGRKLLHIECYKYTTMLKHKYKQRTHTKLRYEWRHFWNQNEHTEQNIAYTLMAQVFNFAIFYVNLAYCVILRFFNYPLK